MLFSFLKVKHLATVECRICSKVAKSATEWCFFGRTTTCLDSNLIIFSSHQRSSSGGPSDKKSGGIWVGNFHRGFQKHLFVMWCVCVCMFSFWVEPLPCFLSLWMSMNVHCLWLFHITFLKSSGRSHHDDIRDIRHDRLGGYSCGGICQVPAVDCDKVTLKLEGQLSKSQWVILCNKKLQVHRVWSWSRVCGCVSKKVGDLKLEIYCSPTYLPKTHWPRCQSI